MYDGTIYQRALERNPIESWEFHLGDGHFSHLPNVIGPFKKPRNQPFSQFQLQVNKIIAHYQRWIEHLNHGFNSHAAFHTRWRGGIELLLDVCNITAHTTNISLKWRIPYGPWEFRFPNKR